MSRSVQQILSAVLLERRSSWYLSDLAKRLGRAPSTLQRPLSSLVAAGILTRAVDGNRVYYAKDSQCSILPELKGLLQKTVGLVDVLRNSLKRFEKSCLVAFIYGSIARDAEQSSSDIDLLIVGDLTLGDISNSLTKAEKELGRPVNVTVLQPEEFARKITARNHFLHSVLSREKLFVWGSPNELEKLKGAGKGRSAHDE